MNYTTLAIVGMIAFLLFIAMVIVGEIRGGALLDQKVLSCIQAGNNPMECKCAIKSCD